MSRKYDPVPKGEDDLFIGYKTNETIVIPETTQTKYAGQIITEGLFPKLTADKDVYPMKEKK